ncbi:YtcA family lipoprotein [Cupriavidus sp. 30B13]|uniref:YtcA family lipoprotein n=1 Tax=Cupriavidus sp. 30B13 TaxID=3384241 RepID=UPI003B91FBC8
MTADKSGPRPFQRVSAPAALAALAALCSPLQGCAFAGAPAFDLFGAYFPLWLLSALAGALGAAIAYRVFVATGWAQIVPCQLLVNTAIGVTVAVFVWLLGTGQFP